MLNNSLIHTIILVLLIGCGSSSQNNTKVDETLNIDGNIYYGDINNDTVLIINRKSMQLQEVVTTLSHYPYEISQKDPTQLYVINRGDNKIDILENQEIEKSINLPFQPRSISKNGDNILTTSVSKPSAVIINQEKVSPEYSDSQYKTPTSFGSAKATGHPFWINENYFLLLDRTENAIELYKVGTYTPISKLTTSTSVHHVFRVGDSYYGILEGERDKTAPGILQFDIAFEKIKFEDEQLISDFNNTVVDLNSSIWGAHHGAVHPDGKHIYFSSYEGNIFVVDLNLNLVDNFSSGLGVGHMIFHDNLMITTNHHDNFKSFYNVQDPENNTLIKEISFSQTRSDIIDMQSHTSHIVDDKLYFMFDEEDNATLYKINLKDTNNIYIEDSLSLPGSRADMGSLLKRRETRPSDM